MSRPYAPWGHWSRRPAELAPIGYNEAWIRVELHDVPEAIREAAKLPSLIAPM